MSAGLGVYWSMYGTRFAVMAVGLLVGIISARALGPSGRGVYAATLTSAALIVQFGNFGLSSAILYFVSRRPRRSGTFLLVAWVAGIGLLALGLLVYVTLRRLGVVSDASLLIALWAPAQLTALLQEQIFLGVKRFRQYNVLQFGGRCLGLLAAAGAVWLHPADPFAFVGSQLLADVAILVVGTILLLSTGLGTGLHPIAIGPVARLAFRAAPVLIIPFLLIRSDILLMQVFRGSAETGIYSVASQLIDVLLLLPGTFATVLFVSLANSRDPVGVTARAGRNVLVLSSLLAALMALGGPWALPLVFGRPFEASCGPLLVLLPGAVLLGFQTIIGQYFGSKAYPWFLTRYWLVGLALNLGMNLYAIPRFGAMGAAVASTVGYAAVTCLIWRRFARATGVSSGSLWTR